MTLTVPTPLQRLFSRPTSLAGLFQSSPYPLPARRSDVLHADFMDTRPVIFRSEAFEEDLRAEPVTA